MEYQFEELPACSPKVVLPNVTYTPLKPYWEKDYQTWCNNGLVDVNLANTVSTNYSASTMTLSSVATQNANDIGITVAGSINEQKFYVGYIGQLNPTKHVMVLHLLGRTEQDNPVEEAITVKHKPKCSTCGKTNVATAKFCVECGTSLLTAA